MIHDNRVFYVRKDDCRSIMLINKSVFTCSGQGQTQNGVTGLSAHCIYAPPPSIHLTSVLSFDMTTPPPLPHPSAL